MFGWREKGRGDNNNINKPGHEHVQAKAALVLPSEVPFDGRAHFLLFAGPRSSSSYCEFWLVSSARAETCVHIKGVKEEEEEEVEDRGGVALFSISS